MDELAQHISDGNVKAPDDEDFKKLMQSLSKKKGAKGTLCPQLLHC